MQINIKTLEYKALQIGTGQVFGLEEALLKEVERCVEARAMTNCEVQYIDIGLLHEILNEEDVDIILKTGELKFIQPIDIAK